MRVSEYYGLIADQGDLDFVDVDVENDVPVFIDPVAIKIQKGDWSFECQRSLQTFFSALLNAIAGKGHTSVADLIHPLREPNETHLGLGGGRSQGRGLGNSKTSDKLIESLEHSKALQTGLLADLEDTALFIEGIGRDIISDITTCVIRRQLIDYTQRMARFYSPEMKLSRQFPSPRWNSDTLEWEEGYVEDLPRTSEGLLLLVPRSIVRVKMNSDMGKYYRNYVRPIYEEIELEDPGSSLVVLLKSKNEHGEKRKKVMLKELDKKIGTSKTDLVAQTSEHPEALERFKRDLPARSSAPATGNELAETIGTPRVDYREKLEEVLSLPPGSPAANPYHRSVSQLLTAVFESHLGNMKIEQEMHEGLKRVDIAFDNISKRGFFDWLGRRYNCAKVFVECKNYASDVANPELDQLAMRFSDQRGEIGLLLVRSVKNRGRLLARCKNIAHDRRGYILVLEDSDLQALVEEAIEETGLGGARRSGEFRVLRDQFEDLIFN